MTHSYFTPDEWAHVFAAFPGPPAGYRHVSQTQLSLARLYGGATVQGRHFTYFPETDELLRDDVLAWVARRRREAAAAARAEQDQAAAAAQAALPLEGQG